jgi:hypothetical protein
MLEVIFAALRILAEAFNVIQKRLFNSLEVQ